MNKDIIKQILVKFKGDTTDLKKSIAETQKAATSINRSMSLNQQYGTMDKFIKNISKTNENLAKTFTVFQKGMRGVLEGDMQKFERRADMQYKRIINLQRELDRATVAGDKARANRITEVMGNAGGRLGRTMNNYNVTQKALSEAGGGEGGGFLGGLAGGLGRSLGIPALGTSALIGAAAGAAAIKAVQIYANSGMQEVSNIRGITDVSRSYYKPGLQGDLSTAYLMATNPNAMRRAETIAGGRSGDVTGAGVLKMGTRILMSNLATGFGFLGNTDADYTRREQEDIRGNLENIKNSTMSPEKLAYLSGRAPNRLDFQRQFGINDNQRYTYASLARSALMSEDEMMGVASTLRDRVGSNNALNMANAAGRARRSTGMGLDVATNMLGSLGAISGGKATSEQLVEIMSKAFSRGIDDAALAEKITAASIGMIEKTGLAGNSARNASDLATLATLIGPNGQANSRTVNAALAVNDKLSQAFNSGGENEMYRTQVLSQLANQTSDPATALLLLQKNYKDPMQMKNLGADPLFQDLFEGKSSEEINAIGAKAMYRSITGPMALRGRSPNDAFLRTWNNTKDFQKSLNAATRIATAYGAVSGGTPESQQAYTAELLRATGNEEIQKAIITNMTGSDVSRQMFGRQAVVNKGVSGEMGQNLIKQDQIQDAAATRDIQAGDVARAAGISQRQTKSGLGTGIDGSIDGVINALENLKGSLRDIGGSPTSRAGGQ